MRLLNTYTQELEEFVGDSLPEYVILSHTWESEEVSFQDIQSGLGETKAGYKKIEGCCRQACEDGFQYAWIDTCCIDKTSSAELSEAINSMFNWYAQAAICYAYLADVDSTNLDTTDVDLWNMHLPYPVVSDSTAAVLISQFASSKWMTRGWTLQELLAPTSVEFYDVHWIDIGSKALHSTALAEITGISREAIIGASLDEFSIACKMSWASLRETTRAEDMAYCLLGIFGVNLPLLYGEGEERAFLRLQEAILKVSEDYSIFVWSNNQDGTVHLGLLADTVRRFGGGLRVSGGLPEDSAPFAVKTFQHADLSTSYFARLPDEPPVLTSRGLRITLWTVKVSTLTLDPVITLYAKIYCRLQVSSQGSGNFRTIFLRLRTSNDKANVYRRDDDGFLSQNLLISDSLDNATFVRSTIYVGQKTTLSEDHPYRLSLGQCGITIKLERVHVVEYAPWPHESITGDLTVLFSQHDANCVVVLLVHTGVNQALVCAGFRSGIPWCTVDSTTEDPQPSLMQLLRLLAFQVENEPFKFSRDRGCVVFTQDCGVKALMKRRPGRRPGAIEFEPQTSFLLTVSAMDKESLGKSWKFGGA